MRDSVLRTQVQRLQQHVETVIPVAFIHGGGTAVNPRFSGDYAKGVLNKNVEVSVLIDHFVHHPGDIVTLRNVDMTRCGHATGALDAIPVVSRRCIVDIGDEHRGPLRRQLPSGRSADSECAASDNRNLAFKPAHDSPTNHFADDKKISQQIVHPNS